MWHSSDGPASAISVDNSTVQGEETSQIPGHSESFLRGINQLLDGSDTIARKVAMVGKGVESGGSSALPQILARFESMTYPGHSPRSSPGPGAMNLLSPWLLTYCAAASNGGGVSGRAPTPCGDAIAALAVSSAGALSDPSAMALSTAAGKAAAVEAKRPVTAKDFILYGNM